MSFLNKVTNDPRSNGTIKAIANDQLANNYWYNNDLDEAKKKFELVGELQHWQVAGAFDNVSGSGFDKNYGPVNNPQENAEFENRFGAKVKWFNLPSARADGWLDFSYSFDIYNVIIYAQTFLNSTKAQEVQLRAGVSGSLKIWLNDQLVSNIPEERNTDFDVYNYKVTLNKGYNRILVQVGESEANHSNFMIRITDNNGHPIPELTTVATPQPYTKGTTTNFLQVPLFAEEFFQNKLKENPENLMNQVLLAETYNRNDKAAEAKKILIKLKQRYPQSSFISMLLMDVYTRENNQTDYSVEFENVKTQDPECRTAMIDKIDEAYNNEDYDEMERQIQLLDNKFGLTESSYRYRLAIAAKKGKIADMIKYNDQAITKYPDEFYFTKIKALIEKETNKNINGAINIYEKFLKNYYSDDAMKELSNLYVSNGVPDKGVKLYNIMIENKPYSTGYISELASYYSTIRDHKKAIEYYNMALNYAPYWGKYWTDLGMAYDEMNNKTQAIAALKKAIYYYPLDYDAKTLLRKLSGKEDYFTNFEKVDPDKLFKSTVTATTTKDDAGLILLDETQKIIYPEGGAETRKFLMIKVLNKNGVDIWKEYGVDYNPYNQGLNIEEAKVYKQNGTKIEAEINDDYVVFTGLEVGDVVYLQYKLKDYVYGKLINEFFDSYNINTFFPREKVKISYIIPNNKKFQYKVMNGDLPLVTKTIDDYTVYTWEKKAMPAIVSEDYMPKISDVGIVLHLSSLPDWNYVANLYSDMSTSKAKSEYEVKEVLDSILPKNTKLTELQKAKAIYEWIENNIHYSHVSFRQSRMIPQKASKTINTRLGDCKDLATLYVSLAKEAGLKANLVLIDTRDKGDHDLILPSLNFNHCIAKVTADNKEYAIELTYPQLPFAAQTRDLKGCLSLNIPNESNVGTNTLQSLFATNSLPNNVTRTADISLENNDIVVSKRTVYTGYYAASNREIYQEKSQEERQKDIQQLVSNMFTKPVKLNSFSFSELNSQADTFVIEYSYVVKNGLTDIGGMKIFELPWNDAESTPTFLNSEERKYNINFW
jgi:tetratricopeptide (TPR) repeat protein